MKKIMLAIALVFMSINFTSCTPTVEQNQQATQGEQEQPIVNPHDEEND